MTIMTQRAAVLGHMQKKGSITSWEAIENYGATRLSAIIFNLKEEGYQIGDTWEQYENRFGETVRVKRYFLKRNKRA